MPVADGVGQRLLVDDAAARRVDDADARAWPWPAGRVPNSPTVSGVFGGGWRRSPPPRPAPRYRPGAHPWHGPAPGTQRGRSRRAPCRTRGPRWATSEPARPRPTTPSTLPCSSTPSHFERSQRPATSAECAWGMLRGLRQQQRHRLLGDGEDVRRRCVHNHDAPIGGRRHVDVVEADTGPPDDLERGPRGQHVAGDLCGRADDQRVGARDHLEQIRRGSAPHARPPRALRRRAGRARSPRSSPLPVPVPPRWPPYSPRLIVGQSCASAKRSASRSHPRRGRRRPARRTSGSSPVARTPLRGPPPPWPR